MREIYVNLGFGSFTVEIILTAKPAALSLAFTLDALSVLTPPAHTSGRKRLSDGSISTRSLRTSSFALLTQSANLGWAGHIEGRGRPNINV